MNNSNDSLKIYRVYGIVIAVGFAILGFSFYLGYRTEKMNPTIIAPQESTQTESDTEELDTKTTAPETTNTKVAPTTTSANNANSTDNKTVVATTEEATPSVEPQTPTIPPQKTTDKLKLLASFHYQLDGTISADVPADIYVVDLFDTPSATIDELQKKGTLVFCYFSAGTAEDWRDDYAQFSSQDLGDPLGDWEGETWVDIRSNNVRKIMAARVSFAANKGCDGVDPDNVDAYSNSTGLSFSAQDQLDYNRYLATQAKTNGLLVSLKNDIEQAAALASSFDIAVNESCYEYNECSGYSVFTKAGKPVLNIEYGKKYTTNTDAFAKLCDTSRAQNMSTSVLPLQLDGSFRLSCQ